MDIYSSTKAAPYVYMCIHKETCEFYIGYRTKNVKLDIPSHLDLPTYKTSSKLVNNQFNNFEWYIVAEFFDNIEAYDFEQQLIFENWGNPLLLNKSCHYKKSRFRYTGGVSCSEETKRKIGEANKLKLKGIIRSESFRQKISRASKGRRHTQETKNKLSEIVAHAHKARPRQWSEEAKMKLSLKNKGRKMSDEQKKKISNTKRLRDIERPMSEETKRKISESLKGRPSPHKGRASPLKGRKKA